MKKIWNFAFGYLIAGLLAGLYFRELTKAEGFTGDTQLGVLHTHLLTLGVVFLLVVLAFEKLFRLSESRQFTWFFRTYNAGVVVTTGMLAVHGTMTVLGKEVSPAISGIAGLGHILLTVGFVLFFFAVQTRITNPSPVEPAAEKQALSQGH
ncbi:DUF2871 domain-containing protein [Rhodococcus sp. NPDC058521]|uniref:DUF2871 domain-containing protein n=1 Tax=Rhodococcus sp. NPDC058521 TaxID=3346536 RepID=UPI0036572DFF